MLFVRWIDWFNKQLHSLLGILLIIMVVVVFLQVLVRFIFTYLGVYTSVPWTEELARYLMIWMIFMGAALATRYAKMLAVDALIFAIPALPAKLVKVVAHLLSLIFYTCIFIVGIQWANVGLTVKAPVMGILMIFPYSAIAVGGGLMVLNTIALFIDTFQNKRDIRQPYESTENIE